MDFEHVKPTPEIEKAMTDEINTILDKYDCDLTVTSTIVVLQRVPITPKTDGENIQDTQEEATEVLETDGSNQA